MTSTDQSPNNISQSEIDKLVKEAAKQGRTRLAAGVFTATAAVLGLATLGAWSLFEDRVKAYIVNTVYETDLFRGDSLPAGAVIALDSTDIDQDACPVGWSPFKEARSRFIVGAGDPSEAPGKLRYDENGFRLRHFVLRQHGGEERVRLQPSQLTKHDHGFKDSKLKRIQTEQGVSALVFGVPDNPASTFHLEEETLERKTEQSREDLHETHNNMPPYIALYYCKKNGA